MEWKTLEPRLDSWADKIKPFFDRGGFIPIYEHLKQQTKNGAKIAPISQNVYRAFKETEFDNLKAVIVCQDPYFKFTSDGNPIASGIAMDCSITQKIQPTLKQFYGGIEKELFNGLNLNYIDSYDLSYLSKQGVLLLNTALTVEKDKPNSHVKLWEDFTIFLLKEVIGPTKVPVLFLGKEAAKYEPALYLTNPTKCVKHPASASYSGGIWDSEGAFKWLNKHIWNSCEDSIEWLNIDVPY